METNKVVKCYTNDTVIIERKRGWRTKMNAVIKSFPPASLESAHRVAILEIRISSKCVIIEKKWRTL